MPTAVTRAENTDLTYRPRFPPEIERAFQESYYHRMLPALRASLALFLVASVISAVVSARSAAGFVFTRPETFTFSGVALLHLGLLGATFRREFATYWQLFVVVGTLIYLGSYVRADIEALLPFAALCFIVIVSRLQRLQFRWMAFQMFGVVLINILDVVANPSATSTMERTLLAVAIGGLLVSIPLIWSYKSEKFDRSEFFVKHILAQERNEERQKREQTEAMLHILSQAIGGIVHDLGNPLTAVQGGADTLRYFIDEEEPDKQVMHEFVDMVSDGAQMLNYLRLSLMEQTRVLEGKPVPVELKPASVSHLVRAGAHYQKPRFATGRTLSFDGDDMVVQVDEMRFITVFMNLIGNALKYSDGAIRVIWRINEQQVLIAVQDQGLQDQGISREQAEKLFVPFGRLDTHAEIEGTGLGLLSVRKIAEAHGGEVYIEGYSDGTPNSRPFSTAQGPHLSLLEEGFRTAFVTACPLKIVAPTEKECTPIAA